jgi:PKD repeat protein
VSFDASTSLPGFSGEALTGYAWDFGDGTTGSGVTITHTFAASGRYTVKLTVTNAAGQSDTLSLVVDDVPVARFLARRLSGEQVSFDASSSSPALPGEALTGYAWDFGDGTTGSGVTVTHTFTAPGPFTVQLTVTSSTGQTDTTSFLIQAFPLARFTFKPQSGGRVVFDASTSQPGKQGETLTGYSWDFGDGTAGGGVTVTHTFAGPGPYTVKLTVTSSTGQTNDFSVAVLGGSITGTVYRDANGNGIRDSGEGGLAGWTVYLDADNNGRLEPGEVSTVTAADGSYAFTGLGGGVTYHVRELVPAGWAATTPTGIDVTVGAGKKVARQNFGDAPLPMISGKVLHDFSGNQTNELPLKGWVVYLDANNNGKLDPYEVRTTTAADGSYAFTGLKPGVTYHVRVVVPPGWVATTPTRINVTAVADMSATGNDFGVGLPASVSGNVFYDANADGRKDNGERGLAGWTVFLDANGNGVLDPGEVSVLTDARGNYTLKGLAPGTYTVRLRVKTGWKSLLPPSGFYEMSLTSGEVAGGEDFSATRP